MEALIVVTNVTSAGQPQLAPSVVISKIRRAGSGIFRSADVHTGSILENAR